MFGGYTIGRMFGVCSGGSIERDNRLLCNRGRGTIHVPRHMQKDDTCNPARPYGMLYVEHRNETTYNTQHGRLVSPTRSLHGGNIPYVETMDGNATRRSNAAIKKAPRRNAGRRDKGERENSQAAGLNPTRCLNVVNRLLIIRRITRPCDIPRPAHLAIVRAITLSRAVLTRRASSRSM